MTKTVGKYILGGHDGHTAVPCEDLIQWATWFENAANRRVRLTQVGPYEVSTVFLGLDHSFLRDIDSPILFETMVFAENGDNSLEFAGECERCSTWDQAIIERIRKPDDQIEELEQFKIPKKEEVKEEEPE